MVRKRLICGIKLSQKDLSITPPLCNACMKGKATRASFPASKSRRAESILDLVHSDLWGPTPVTSIDGTRYVLTLTDDNSRWLWVIFLKSKSDAFKAFVDWLAYVEKETGHKLCTIRTDNGGEYLSQLWNKYLKECGIRHELTSPYTPEQNGVSECQNRTIFDHVRTILINSGLPLFLLPEAIKYIVHTKNRHVTQSLKNTTPFKIHYKKKLISAIYTHLAARCTCIITHPSGTNLSHEQKKASLLDIPTPKKLTGYTFLINSVW